MLPDEMEVTAKSPPPKVSSLETRERLISAAGEVFAELGYEHATVREICKRAGANVAAINYHFRDKQGLYSETFRRYAEMSLQKYPPNMGVGDDAPLEEQLHAFVRSFLHRVLDDSDASVMGKLIAWEMIRPTVALDERINEMWRPMADRLEGYVQAILGDASSVERVRLCTFSIVGQIVFYKHSRPVIDRMYPQQQFAQEEIERIARHVTDFSIAAMRNVGNVKQQVRR